MNNHGAKEYNFVPVVNHKFPESIVLYDGYCNLCSGAVQFILKYEKEPVYYFLSLQSLKVEELIPDFKLKDPPESVILIESGKIFMASEAALKIARKLKFPWRVLYYFIYFPRFLRDPAYNFIAKNRYKFFGKKSSCFIPNPKWKSRFLD